MAAAKTCRRRSARGLRRAAGAPQSSTALNTALSGAMSVLDELPGAVAMSTVSRQVHNWTIQAETSGACQLRRHQSA